MRVITGKARGTNLNTLPGEDITRPTPSMVKEAIFSSIQFELEGRTMLDLYAGSGQMGIEALSRGASKATFVDASREAIEIINSNLKKTKLDNLANVVYADVVQFLSSKKCNEKFDYVFIDPPYAKRALPQTLSALYDSNLLKSTSIVICEDDKHFDFDESEINDKYDIIKNASYGRVSVIYLSPKGD
ncbi:MAG: 16S rRNA (guanine(966)-N(2))-methyltransferase RsmD [Clostridia bacterium]|nr:16S rRNA (guanine(966)-N(2))-methyltransferase RsmD [Clostridia bacterium]